MPRGRGISSKTRWRAQLMLGTAHARQQLHICRTIGGASRDPVAALKIARTATDYARENDLGLYRRFAKVYLGWARAGLGEHENGTTELKQGLAAHTEAGNKAWTPFFAGLLAQVEAEGNQHSEALSRIAEMLTLANEISEHSVDSFLQRIRGEIFSKGDPVNTAAAEVAFIAAIAIARRQKARASNCERRSRWPRYINRPPVPSMPTPPSRPRSKAFRRRRRCRRSPRRWR